ncbi:MAG: ATP-binding cassette domain-containing protein [Phycisphaera sp.]|nr:ATP-binding cassette domain-containing protein [Phycisphaera sp.]
MLRLERIRFDYPAPRDGEAAFRLELPSLELSGGRSMAIIGPSGCGKTTLLRLASGILGPTSGEIEFDGSRLDLMGGEARRRLRLERIGIVFQDFRLLDHLDVLGNVLLPFRLGAGPLDRDARDHAEELLGRLGIDGLARRPVDRLSQGERQRTAICRALVTRPGLVLADEPTGNLDPRNKRVILDELLNAARDRGAAVLAVTHDHELLDAFDEVVDLGANT